MNGKGIPNATVEIWQTDEDGTYDLQKQDGAEVPAMDMRGTFEADANGNYYMRTVLPLGYMIPMDGPVGDMIRAQKRHGYRPSHIHFLIGAPGYRELTTRALREWRRSYRFGYGVWSDGFVSRYTEEGRSERAD